MIVLKTAREIELMRKACIISAEALQLAGEAVKPGVTTYEIDKIAYDYIKKQGAEPNFLHLYGFPATACISINDEVIHGIPSKKRVIKEGDIVSIDLGAKVDGYCADMTRTVAVGKPSDKMRKIYDIVLHAQEAAQAAIAPGLKCCDIDAVARNIIAEEGYGECFGHSTGHGVGIDIHEEPRVSSRCDKLLVPGHIITIEPGIYVPGLGGVRIENTCAVTETGGRPLCGASKELRIL